MFDSIERNRKGVPLQTTLKTDTDTAYFRTQRMTDPACVAAQAVRDAHFSLFGRYAAPGASIGDFETEVTSLQAATAWGKQTIELSILAFARLQDLPRLRALQAETRLLDIGHLIAIDAVLAELGAKVSAEVFTDIDAFLVALFTPTHPGQQLPLRNTVTRRLRAQIKEIDINLSYDPQKRKARTPERDIIEFHEFGIHLAIDGATTALIKQSVEQVSRKNKVSFADAAVGLLTGSFTPEKLTPLTVFGLAGRFHIPGFGWADHEAAATLEEMATRYVSWKDIEQHSTASYSPTAHMRQLVGARDGTCVYPGCSVPAKHCQLDHRLPFDMEGPTTPDNLFLLCQHHHNVKTDRRAYYLPDPLTQEIVWLFDDGTYELRTPDCSLAELVTPVNPHWRSSLDQVRANRANAAEFYARCHKVLDECEGDVAKQKIAELEQVFKMKWEVPVA